MTGWLTLEAAATRVGKSSRTIGRWVAAGMPVRAGMVKLDDLLEAERTARGRRGRPRKPVPSSAQKWHRGDWMQTFTGRQFYPLDPRPEDIDPRDIAHALAMLCRYNGHVDRFYSVAEHCVLMSQAVPEGDALWALLHDATEAYVGDMIRPLKLSMPEYRAAEDRVMEAIAARFGLSGPMPSSVKDADSRILLTERNTLMAGKAPAAWGQDGLEPLPVRVEGWSPEAAEWEYLEALVALKVLSPAEAFS